MALVICLATTKVPMRGREDDLISEFKQLARTFECEIEAVLGRRGPGCYNYGIRIAGDQAEKFADSLAMAMMPARWARTSETFEGFRMEGLD